MGDPGDLGDLSAAYAAVDWSRSPLGPPATWSPTLRWAVDLVRHTRFPAALFWGESFVLLYNQGYADLIGDKHPTALGRRTQEVFPEAWDDIGPLMQGVLDGGEAVWLQDAGVPLVISGRLTERFFTFAYSPVRDADGTVLGVLDIAVDTTRQVVTERRLLALARLNHRLSSVLRVGDLDAAVLEVLDEVAAEDVLALDLRVNDTGASARSDPRLPARVDAVRDVVARASADGQVVLAPVGRPGQPDARTLVVLAPATVFDADHVELVRLLALTVTQHLTRINDLAAGRALSLALQAALLTQPRHSEAFDISVHYQPAAELARVGGDWYDAFPRADDVTMVAVGDVAGHDHEAAAAMGQVRSLLRGMAHLEASSPAAALAQLERAMGGLGVDVLATAVVGDLRQGREAGSGCFTWVNAGHLPPALVHPDGEVELLERPADPMLGMGMGMGSPAPRADHEVELAPGSTLVLYTDGLVERRHEHLDVGLKRLVEALRGSGDLTPQQVCRQLLAHTEDETVEDDIALMVVRVPRV